MTEDQPAPAFEPTFRAGSLVAGRFRIVRFLARGGMGEVYEAEDLELKGRVALKTVRPDVAGDPRIAELFLREVQLARKVTHPNVCQTYDVYRHEPAVGEGSVRLVAMELLEGETLAQRLERRGRLSTEEALSVAEQIIAGLVAAHDAGVIHQDLKTENVTLVPLSGGGVRAVVADFGLARAKTGLAAEGGMVSGTPAYMAPEQMQGSEVTVASDLYALGVLLYEMVTGRLPWPGHTPEAAKRRLREKPPSPREHVPDLDPRWEAVILRCLERDPLERFASVTDVARALHGEEVAPPRRELMARHAQQARARRLKRIGIVAAVVAALALIEVVVFHRTAPSHAPRRSVAVLGFRNLSGRAEAAWVSTALQELLTAELGAGEKLRTVPGDTVARMKADLALPDTESLAPDTLARVGRNLGTDLVVIGSYVALGETGGGRLRLDLRMQETAGGKMLASVIDEAKESELLDLVTRTGARLRESLAVEAAAGGARAAGPSTTESTRLYAEGLARLRLFDALAARDLLERAVAADSSAPLAHAALADAWSALGYDAKAREEAQRAFELSGKLSREERLSVEARYRVAARERDKAVEAYRTLFAFFPDNHEYGLRLAQAQTAAGKGKDALATVASLRALPKPVSEDPRIDLAEAEAALALSEYKLCQASAARAAQKATPQGARLLVAAARFQEGRALARLAEYNRAQAAAQEAQRLFADVGDRTWAGRALNLSGTVFSGRGELAQAKAAYEEALGMFQETGNRLGAAMALNNLAVVARQRGNVRAAREMYEQSLAIDREIGDKAGEAGRLNNIAGIQWAQGDLAGARKLYDSSMAIARDVGDRNLAALALANIASIALEQGDLAAAQSGSEEALEAQRKIGSKARMGGAFQALGDLMTARGDLAAARARYDETLALRTQLGDKGGIATTRLALATLAIEEGRPAGAEASAREAAKTFATEKQADDEATARAVLARSLIEQAKPQEARAALEPALAQAKQTQSFSLRLTVATAEGRLLAAEKRFAEAARRLEWAIAEATRAGFFRTQVEARLVLGQIELSAGRPEAGRVRLAALAKEADARGFGLVARNARAHLR